MLYTPKDPLEPEQPHVPLHKVNHTPSPQTPQKKDGSGKSVGHEWPHPASSLGPASNSRR